MACLLDVLYVGAIMLKWSVQIGFNFITDVLRGSLSLTTCTVYDSPKEEWKQSDGN